MKKTLVMLSTLLIGLAPAAALSQTPLEELGKQIFFDQSLSVNSNQSCASCHDPATGWTGPDSGVNAGPAVYEGSIAGRFGNRKPPTSAYATSSPLFHMAGQKKKAHFVGGNFWDGRATGEKLGNPAADQAQGPFLNPLEQALVSPGQVVERVCGGSYGWLFLQVWGYDRCDSDKIDQAYDAVGLSVAAYEASSESNAFTSKYDYFLAGLTTLTSEEKKGLNLFTGKGKCSNCHTVKTESGEQPLLTDFTFDNLGIPRNPQNPFYAQTAFNSLGSTWVDKGLGGFLATRAEWTGFAAEQAGAQKVPTLRNVDKRPWFGFVKAYGHNGYFKSLEGIVHFYNTRDAKPVCANAFTSEADAIAQDCWPAAEVMANVNRSELGNLKLTPAQERQIVAFLKTLTDGYQP